MSQSQPDDQLTFSMTKILRTTSFLNKQGQLQTTYHLGNNSSPRIRLVSNSGDRKEPEEEKEDGEEDKTEAVSSWGKEISIFQTALNSAKRNNLTSTFGSVDYRVRLEIERSRVRVLASAFFLLQINLEYFPRCWKTPRDLTNWICDFPNEESIGLVEGYPGLLPISKSLINNPPIRGLSASFYKK